METEAPCYTWRRTSGAAPDAVKVARPVLNGGDEETGLYRPRLVATQHHQTGTVMAYVCGRRTDEAFLQLTVLLEPYRIARYRTDYWGAYIRHLDPAEHHPGKRNTQQIGGQTFDVADPDQAAHPQDDLFFPLDPDA